MEDKKMTVFDAVFNTTGGSSVFLFHPRFYYLSILSNFLRLKKFVNGEVPLRSVTARCTNVATFESYPLPPKSCGDCKDSIAIVTKIKNI